jgi:hypothetical protein
MQQNKGWALQAAEKLVRVVGQRFIPGTKATESMLALAPEVRFSPILAQNWPFSAACLAPEGCVTPISPEFSTFSAARLGPVSLFQQ